MDGTGRADQCGVGSHLHSSVSGDGSFMPFVFVHSSLSP